MKQSETQELKSKDEKYYLSKTSCCQMGDP